MHAVHVLQREQSRELTKQKIARKEGEKILCELYRMNRRPTMQTIRYHRPLCRRFRGTRPVRLLQHPPRAHVKLVRVHHCCNRAWPPLCRLHRRRFHQCLCQMNRPALCLALLRHLHGQSCRLNHLLRMPRGERRLHFSHRAESDVVKRKSCGQL